MPVRRSASIPGAGVRCLVVALAFVGVACSGSGQQYVKNSDDKTYFKVPDGWKLFDEESLVADVPDLSDEQRDDVLSTRWQTGFDASPEPTVSHLFTASARYPTGFAVVEPLTQGEIDVASDQSLRNLFIPVDSARDGGQFTSLAYENVNRGGGMHGIRFRGRVNAAEGSEVYASGPTFTFEQISLLNQARDKRYSLIVMCSSKCFERHLERIEQIIDSWTVNDD